MHIGSKKIKIVLTLGGRLYPRFFDFHEFEQDFIIFFVIFFTFSYFAKNDIVSKPQEKDSQHSILS